MYDGKITLKHQHVTIDLTGTELFPIRPSVSCSPPSTVSSRELHPVFFFSSSAQFNAHPHSIFNFLTSSNLGLLVGPLLYSFSSLLFQDQAKGEKSLSISILPFTSLAALVSPAFPAF